MFRDVAGTLLLTCLLSRTDSVQPLHQEELLQSRRVVHRSRQLQTPSPTPLCPDTTLKTRVDSINSHCCFMPNGVPLDCAAGPPRQCTATCAGVFVPFWAACKDRHLYPAADTVNFDVFDSDCKSTHFNDNGGGSTGSSVLDPTLCHIRRSADREVTFSWVEISPLQMDHCIGTTPAEQIACGVAPPRQGITASDIGNLIGVNEWTSTGQSTWAADDGWCEHFAQPRCVHYCVT
jgi:hypothetical protein